MATVVYNALHAYEANASDAEVTHQFFGMNLTEIRIFHHFMVLACILERQVVFGQFLGFKRLL